MIRRHITAAFSRHGISLLMLASAVCFSSVASATTFNGKIVTVTNSASSNYAFRVSLDTGMGSCTNGFSFLNTSDDNYQAKVATLLTAYSLGKTVQILSTPVAGGFCQMSDLSIVP